MGQKGSKLFAVSILGLRSYYITVGSRVGKDSASRTRCSVGGSGCHVVGNHPGSFILKDNCRRLLTTVICFKTHQGIAARVTTASSCVELCL